MTTQTQPTIAKNYEPQDVETHWYKQWLDTRCFERDDEDSENGYCIVMPPPNVTGVLTMGHVLNGTIQDILVRRARQMGKKVLWIPGTDHAGIATQTKVEQALKAENTSRQALGREQFLERANQWRDKHGGIIIEQFKRLGVSCAWDQSVHTLDPDYSKGVIKAFVELYKRGYIYRGKRIVNWCCSSLTALSDEEVVMKPNQGKLYSISYTVVELPSHSLTIATTRPETLMGDVAVAVHPDDIRYQHLIGRHVYRPLSQEPIPIIADTAVEKDFGTGVLKITPAHDAADFAIGQRHGLPMRNIMHPDGKLNDLAGVFSGLDRLEARQKVVAKLKEIGILVEEKTHDNMVGYSERADQPIEPRVSEQWFLKYPKVQEAKQAVTEGMIRFWPQRWEKVYMHWLENIQDWCISRQLWWGHRIPVWYKKNSDRSDPQSWYVSETPPQSEDYEQDEDVMDTWFSSWLWPMGVLGWPDEQSMFSRKINTYYPTTDLVTGPDIIFFWVSRMIMAGLEFFGPAKQTLTLEDIQARIPFKNVYFTGIIRDDKGRKMSKSLGNSPDPLDLINQYGADGVRFGIMSMAPQGQDILFSQERLGQGRLFSNKLWNACRFRQMQSASQSKRSLVSILQDIEIRYMNNDDQAILAKLISTTEIIDSSYTEYAFNSITQSLYSFFWSDFCDWYLEVCKARPQEHKKHTLAIQDYVLRQLLMLLHPFMPFITEELAHQLGYIDQPMFIQNQTILNAKNLKEELEKHGVQLDEQAASFVENLRETVTILRALKAQYNVNTQKNSLFYYTATQSQKAAIESSTDIVYKLVGCSDLIYKEHLLEELPSVVTPLGTFYLELAKVIDVDAEKIRLAKEIEQLSVLIASNQAKLSNEQFVSKAPANVIEGARKLLAENQFKKTELEKVLNSYH